MDMHMQRIDLDDLVTSSCILDTALSIRSRANQLTFGSWKSYCDTIQKIESESGRITEALENLVVYITIMRYASCSSQDNGRVFDEMESYLALNFMCLYNALAGYDPTSAELCSSVFFLMADFMEPEGIQCIGKTADVHEHWVTSNNVSSKSINIIDLAKYIDSLEDTWELESVMRFKSDRLLATLIISKFFTIELYKKVIKQRLNVTSIAVDSPMPRYNHDHIRKAMVLSDNKSSMALKYRLLGKPIEELRFRSVDLTYFDCDVLLLKAGVHTGGTDVNLLTELNTIVSTSPTKILTFRATI